MTARTAWPTVAGGDTWTAGQFNTYMRDNDKAYWVFTTAGDLAYATDSANLARLAIGAKSSLFTAGASAPSWVAKYLTTGQFHTIGQDDGVPDTTILSTWTDIPGATKTIVLTATCSIFVFASITGYAVGSSIVIRAVVNGVADSNPTVMSNYLASPARNECLMYIYKETGVTAGSRVVKLQSTGPNYVTNTRFIALAIAE